MNSFYIRLFPIFLISCLGLLVYSNAFYSPFHFDDKAYIIDNTSIRDIQDLSGIWNFCPCRFLTFLSLALNYHFHHLDVLGYHLFNIAVHLGSAILVWWLTLLTLSTPAMKGTRITSHADTIALFAGLIFVSHPVQTEAVTFIWQRTASLAAFFYLLTMCLYARSRSIQGGVSKYYYIASLITTLAAMFTKENTITLPLMVLLYEFTFFNTKGRLNWKYINPFLLALLIIPLTMLLTRSQRFQEIHNVVTGPGAISPMHYFLTQFRVMITYIRLAFLPLNQNLDYDYPVFKSFLELPVLISFISLTAVIYLAARFFSRYRLLSFSIFWFFLTLLPESSILPLKDVIFEHRLYLPMAGYSIFLIVSIYHLFEKNNFKTMIKALIVILAFYSFLAYQRNRVWDDDLRLWDDVIQKSPHKARPYNNRGNIYTRQGNLSMALSDYDKAIALNPEFADAYNDRGSVYGKQNDLPHALSDLDKAIEIDPDYADAYNNRGDVYGKQGNYDDALSNFNKVIGLRPDDAEAHYNRGVIFDGRGDTVQALSDYTKAIEINPDIPEVYIYRGAIYAKQRNFTQAMSDFTKAIELAPDNGYAYNNRAVLYFQMKEYDNAWQDAKRSEDIGYAVNPRFMDALQQAAGKDR